MALRRPRCSDPRSSGFRSFPGVGCASSGAPPPCGAPMPWTSNQPRSACALTGAPDSPGNTDPDDRRPAVLVTSRMQARPGAGHPPAVEGDPEGIDGGLRVVQQPSTDGIQAPSAVRQRHRRAATEPSACREEIFFLSRSLASSTASTPRMPVGNRPWSPFGGPSAVQRAALAFQQPSNRVKSAGQSPKLGISKTSVRPPVVVDHSAESGKVCALAPTSSRRSVSR